MKFIVDAQLPRSLAAFLREQGHDAVHASELPNGNDTPDAAINELSLAEFRIVISKDGDFYDSFSSKREPYKLLHVKTGNIRNSELIGLFAKNLDIIIRELAKSDVVEISRFYIITLH